MISTDNNGIVMDPTSLASAPTLWRCNHGCMTTAIHNFRHNSSDPSPARVLSLLLHQGTLSPLLFSQPPARGCSTLWSQPHYIPCVLATPTTPLPDWKERAETGLLIYGSCPSTPSQHHTHCHRPILKRSVSGINPYILPTLLLPSIPLLFPHPPITYPSWSFHEETSVTLTRPTHPLESLCLHCVSVGSQVGLQELESVKGSPRVKG